jgi:hypothetical protein
MKTKISKCLRGLCPPNPLGFIALRPIPQEGMHARAAEAAQACGIWAQRGAQVASQRSLILRLGPAMLPATYPGHQRLTSGRTRWAEWLVLTVQTCSL